MQIVRDNHYSRHSGTYHTHPDKNMSLLGQIARMSLIRLFVLLSYSTVNNSLYNLLYCILQFHQSEVSSDSIVYSCPDYPLSTKPNCCRNAYIRFITKIIVSLV